MEHRQAGAQSGRDRQHEQPVRDPPAERSGGGEGLVHVQRVEVTGQARERDQIRLGDSAPRRDERFVQRQVLEVQPVTVAHSVPRLDGNFGLRFSRIAV
jgi:hypothetical protein